MTTGVVCGKSGGGPPTSGYAAGEKSTGSGNNTPRARARMDELLACSMTSQDRIGLSAVYRTQQGH